MNPRLLLLATGLFLGSPAAALAADGEAPSRGGSALDALRRGRTSGDDDQRAGAPGNPWGGLAVVIGAAALGAGVVVLRRRSTPSIEEDTIRVLADRGVGGKTKVVLLGIKNREVLISVSDKGADLISEWLTDDDAPAPRAEARTEPAPAEPAPAPTGDLEDEPEPNTVGSAAIQGLLALRRESQHKAPAKRSRRRPHVDTIEHDSEWSRSLMAKMYGKAK